MLLPLVSDDVRHASLNNEGLMYSTIASRATAEPVIPTEGSAIDSSNAGRETILKSSKRGSVFGNLFNRKDSNIPTERKEKEVTPLAPTKDNDHTPSSTIAPQIEDPTKESNTEPIDATAPTSTASAIATSPSENKGGIFGFMKQKEAQHQASLTVLTHEYYLSL